MTDMISAYLPDEDDRAYLQEPAGALRFLECGRRSEDDASDPRSPISLQVANSKYSMSFDFAYCRIFVRAITSSSA